MESDDKELRQNLAISCAEFNKYPDGWAIVKRLILSQKGTECIYRESLIISHRLIDEVLVDDWGVKLYMTDLNSPGFIGCKPDSFISARWDCLQLNISAEMWHAANIGWTIYFSKDLLASVIDLASSVRHEDIFERHKNLSRPLNDFECQITIR